MLPEVLVGRYPTECHHFRPLAVDLVSEERPDTPDHFPNRQENKFLTKIFNIDRNYEIYIKFQQT